MLGLRRWRMLSLLICLKAGIDRAYRLAYRPSALQGLGRLNREFLGSGVRVQCNQGLGYV